MAIRRALLGWLLTAVVQARSDALAQTPLSGAARGGYAAQVRLAARDTL